MYVLSHTTYSRNNIGKKFEGNCGLWILNVSNAKLYTPSTLNIQMKLILLWVWAERAVLGRAKTALKFKYEIEIG